MWNIWDRFGSYCAKLFLGKISMKMFTPIASSGKFLFSHLWYQVLFKWSVRRKLFFPLFHVYFSWTFNCFFWSFGFGTKRLSTEHSCAGTGWGCRRNGLKIDQRPLSPSHQMAMYVYPLENIHLRPLLPLTNSPEICVANSLIKIINYSLIISIN